MKPITSSHANGIFEESVDEQELYFEGALKMGLIHCTDHPTVHPIQVSLIFI